MIRVRPFLRPRDLLVAATLAILALSAGCATRPARAAHDAEQGEAAQPACQPADFLPGRRITGPPADGCWNEANLAKMAAHPDDLVRGRALGPANGAHEALAVDVYQKGQVKPLAGQDSTSSSVQTLSAGGVTGP